MGKEEYVSFKIAKLLKEKGFYWDCDHYYKPNGEIARTFHTEGSRHINSTVLYEHQCLAPTQQMACDWLKKEKGTYISVVPDFNEYGEYPDDLYWFARVYDLRNGDYIHSTKLYIGSQEAFEAALEFALTNLI